MSVDALTIHEAAETTGWSPRMLRYVESMGLIQSKRSPAGYRLYGPEELQRLRTLRELLNAHDVGLAEMGFEVVGGEPCGPPPALVSQCIRSSGRNPRRCRYG